MPVRPVSIEEFAAANPPRDAVDVRTGAWNVGTTSGYDFSQWAGSSSQRQALEEVWTLRRFYGEVTGALKDGQLEALAQKLDQAKDAILTAETSCYLFWGDAWIPKLHQQTGAARRILDEIRSK